MIRRRLFIVLLLAAGISGQVHAQMQVSPETRAKARVVARECRSDIETLCAAVVPGEGRIAACLSDNRDKLSPSCGAALSDLVQQ